MKKNLQPCSSLFREINVPAKETFKKNMKTAIRGVRIKLLELEAKTKNERISQCNTSTKHLDIIEELVDGAPSRLFNLMQAEEYTWE